MEDNRPNSQKDLELRLKAGHDPKKFAELAAERDGLNSSTQTSFAVEGNDTSAYIGVSPEYATYSDSAFKPMRGDGGPEEEAVDKNTVNLRVNKIVKPVESQQVEGVGSTDPLIYSETSGSVWKTEVVEGEDAPTTVEEAKKLKAKDAPNAGAVIGTGVKFKEAAKTPAPQGTTPTPPSVK